MVICWDLRPPLSHPWFVPFLGLRVICDNFIVYQTINFFLSESKLPQDTDRLPHPSLEPQAELSAE